MDRYLATLFHKEEKSLKSQLFDSPWMQSSVSKENFLLKPDPASDTRITPSRHGRGCPVLASLLSGRKAGTQTLRQLFSPHS